MNKKYWILLGIFILIGGVIASFSLSSVKIEKKDDTYYVYNLKEQKTTEEIGKELAKLNSDKIKYVEEI